MRTILLVLGIVYGAVWLRAEEAADSPTAQDLLVVPSPEPRPGDPDAAPVPEATRESPAEEVAQDGSGDDTAPAASPDAEEILPPPFPISRYQELWERSPFQLESAAPPPAESAALAQRYALTGIAEIGGEPIAFLMERATQQRLMVKQQEGESGLSLVQVDVVQTKYESSTATVRQGSEVGVVKFDAGAAMATPVIPQPQVYAPPNVPGVPQPGMPGMPMGQPAQPVPGQPPRVAGIQPAGVPAVPGVIPGPPGQGVPSNGQVQQPGQQPMPPPRVIRRRAIVPAAP